MLIIGQSQLDNEYGGDCVGGRKGEVLWTDFVSAGSISSMTLSTSRLIISIMQYSARLQTSETKGGKIRTLNKLAPFLESPEENPISTDLKTKG
jgi:hypothetical protein